MGLTLRVKHPHFPDGHEFGIHGLGRFINNGDPTEITSAQEARFLAEVGTTVKEAFEHDFNITVEGTPTVDAPPPVQEVEDQGAAPVTPVTPVVPVTPVEVTDPATQTGDAVEGGDS